jgi:formylglycine-generating enzyme required for sulfatase activity
LTQTIYVEDGRGMRRIDVQGFPLSIGGTDADIQLPDHPTPEPVAYIGLTDGEMFVQPDPGNPQVVCNGTPVVTSQWLHDGDVLGIGQACVVIEIKPDHVVLRSEKKTAEEKPSPVIVPVVPRSSGKDVSGTVIKPVDFKPTVAGATRKRRSIRPLAFLFWVALVLLGAATWYIFTARSVAIEIEPSPDLVELQGSPFTVEVGGRYLMRQGEYILVAEKEGYARLEVPLIVTEERNQEYRFTLDKSPGFLAVNTTPVDGAVVSIDGEEIGTTPLSDVELPPGEYEVLIRAERFRDLTTRVRIAGAGSVETLNAELLPRWAAIRFRSVPPGARVRIGGGVVGTTPVTADLIEGAHDYELILEGYKPYRSRIGVVAGEAQTLSPVELDLLDGNLVLTSNPTASNVTVDGVYSGQTPLDLVLEPNEPHEISVSHAGFETETRQVQIPSGEAQTLNVELTAQLGVLEIVCDPPDAELYVNGDSRGRANQVIRLAAVPQQIEIKKDGYEPFGTTVTPRPGFPQSIEVVLETREEVAARSRPPVLQTSQGHELRLIEPLRFRMGASRREPGRRANETFRDVELTRPYYMATREVTNRQFREFKKEHRSGVIREHNLEVDHHPVVRVIWDDAARYCNWLSEKDSLPPAYVQSGGKWVAAAPPTTGYRLPTEAEWVRAARYPAGGEGLKYPWGGSLPVATDSGNYADESANGLVPVIIANYNDSFPVTAPADSFEPNALGLYNLGGNVSEWMNDYYTIYRSSGSEVARDPMGPSEGKYHVIRGASWMHGSVTELRLSYRDYGADPRPDVGFRIARYP